MVISDQERSMGKCQSDSEESEGNTSGGSRSGSSSERSRSRSRLRDPDVSAAPLEEDSNDAGVMSVLAIEAVMKFDTHEDIDKVDDIDFVDEVEESYDFLTECDPNMIPDVEDVAGEVIFPSNSSLPPPRVRLVTAEYIKERPNLEVVIPEELEIIEDDVPAKGLDDSSVSHHVLVCREEPVHTIVEESLKPSEVMDALKRWINLDAGRWDSPNSGRAYELEADGDEVKSRIPDSGGVWSAICVLIVVAIVVGMEKELNDEKKDAERHTLNEFTTDARAITESERSTAFDTEACSDRFVDDPGGLLVEDMPGTWINEENREISIESVSKMSDTIIMVQGDIPGLDSIVDESRGSNGPEGLIPVGISIEEV
ncbi:hypothetical protein F5887DRAFT_1080686 [Amanita rubescens]|nr:hypothetical protein F5887DRAFT_1080686 [Amanita rubescens]